MTVSGWEYKVVDRRLSRQQFLRITGVAGVSLAFGGGLVKALLRQAVHRIRETRVQMGTLVTVSVVHPDPATARRMVAAVFAEMERLESMLSRYRAGTFISQLNRDGVVHGAPIEVVHVVQTALEYSAITHGAFDVTVAPVLDLYRSSFDRTGAPPPESEVEEALSLVGYRHVFVDDGTIAFAKPGMSVTLDGIAKGYIVDQAVRVLTELGAERVLIDAGGDMGSVGERSPGEGWRVAIQHPRNEKSYLGTLQLHGESVATSGDYLQYFTEDKRFHHILDPRTGTSPDHTSAVTIVTGTAMQADALATAIFVLGPQDGLRLLNQLEDVEGMIVTKGQDVFKSTGLSRYT